MTQADRIPFHRPSIGPEERAAAMAVLDSGWLTTGERTMEFEAAIARATGADHAVAVNSATAALHLALEAVGIGPDDEVVVPTYTFATCGEVVRYLGARPRLADVDARTLNITAETIATQFRASTKAVIVVHFAGLMAEMTPILALCAERGIAVIEDAAHAIPASRAGRAAGTLGIAGALSFYATKTVTTGEGGMLLTDDERIADRARTMRLHGISRDAWNRYTASGSWYYEIEDVGFKYNLTDLAAAIGLVQLERAEEMLAERERVATAYRERLGNGRWADLVELPADPDMDTVHARHLYPIRLRSEVPGLRASVIERMGAAGVGTSVHFIPLHLHPYYRRTYGYQAEDLPIAAREYEREISLPIYPDLSETEIDRVCDTLSGALATAAVST